MLEQLPSVVESENLRLSLANLVQVALDRVREANIDTCGVQRIHLRNVAERMVYKIQDDKAVYKSRMKMDVKSDGDLSKGLYIYGLCYWQLVPVEKRDFHMILPRSLYEIKDKTISEIAELFEAGEINKIARNIGNATFLTAGDFQNTLEDFKRVVREANGG